MQSRVSESVQSEVVYCGKEAGEQQNRGCGTMLLWKSTVYRWLAFRNSGGVLSVLRICWAFAWMNLALVFWFLESYVRAFFFFTQGSFTSCYSFCTSYHKLFTSHFLFCLIRSRNNKLQFFSWIAPSSRWLRSTIKPTNNPIGEWTNLLPLCFGVAAVQFLCVCSFSLCLVRTVGKLQSWQRL